MTVPLRCVLDTNICIKQFIVDPLTPKVNPLLNMIQLSFENSFNLNLRIC
ncbi:hypothetical protein OSCI_1900010 [Kamptonema sp. PCC 6506]|nr:hypothetical protein OSCI_1900010 [Kamptonema sp. PCC 6506]